MNIVQPRNRRNSFHHIVKALDQVVGDCDAALPILGIIILKAFLAKANITLSPDQEKTLRPAVEAATRAAIGMGQGAATPAPQPRTSPRGTVIGSLIPSGSPGTLSRTATALPSAQAPAKAADAASKAASALMPATCQCYAVDIRDGDDHHLEMVSSHWCDSAQLQ